MSRRGSRSRSQFRWASLSVVIVGLLVTALLTIGAEFSYQHDQERLTSLETRLTASALGAAPAEFERDLGRIVDLAAYSPDPSRAFRRSIAPLMKPSGPFASAALIQLKSGRPTVLVHLGLAAIRNPTGAVPRQLYRRAAATGSLVVSRVVRGRHQRIGYLMADASPRGIFVIGGSESLVVGDKVAIAANSPDAGLNVAIYFGSTVRPSDLIASTRVRLPLAGKVSKAVVPFGTGTLTLVASARSALAGTLSEDLPWAIGGAGLALTVVIAVLIERALRRRQLSDALAAENGRLFQEQRDIALSLQRALLPREFPKVAGLEFAGRYVPAAGGTEVGGDWYSVIPNGDRRIYFVVGDVSGHGIEAAAVMAQLRFTIRTLAALGYPPAFILQVASADLDVGTSGHFATALVGMIDDQRQLTVASAGHLPPLLVGPNGANYVSLNVGVPLGLGTYEYESAAESLPAEGSVVAFTDGLVETRSASIDEGLDRLHRLVASYSGPGVDDLVSKIIAELLPKASEDDVALLAVRWSRLKTGGNGHSSRGHVGTGSRAP